MATITYGGVKYKQIRHAVFCFRCKETVVSLYQHDYKVCECGAVGVDGGILPGNRVIGKPEDMEIRNMYCAFVNGKTVWLPEWVVKIESSLNTLPVQMVPCSACSVCSEGGHKAADCPSLYSDVHPPGPPQPTGPRGQGDDDD